MADHAKLSASGSERWMNCPGSVKLSEGIPQAPASKYADEGTKAHEVLEKMLKGYPATSHSQAMIDNAIVAWDHIMMVEMSASHHALLFAETKVDLSFIGPDMWGTLDAAVVDEFRTLHVFDYKYGAGVVVEPKDNSQLIYYALGLLHKYAYNFTHVVLTIVQPRAEHPSGPIRSHTMTLAEIVKWEDRFRKAVVAVNSPKPKLEPGDWCRWCPAKVKCPAISLLAMKQAQVDFDEDAGAVVVPASSEIKNLGTTLKAIEKLEVWIEAVKAYAFESLQRGVPVPGYKLVQKRSIRRWIEGAEDAIKKKFGDRAFEKSLMSPAQFEKAFKGDLPTMVTSLVDKYTSSASSGVTMVPSTDSRPEYNCIDTDFSEVVEEPKKGDVVKKVKRGKCK